MGPLKLQKGAHIYDPDWPISRINPDYGYKQQLKFPLQLFCNKYVGYTVSGMQFSS